jgi:GT2 family glycosyltransferase
LVTSLDSVVVNYKTAADLAAFLHSYQQNPPAEGALWVANVCPTTADLEVVRRAQAEGLKFEHRVYEANVGYARACNELGSMGSSDVVAVFNADVILKPEALDTCAGMLVSQPRWGVLGPRQVDDHNKITAGGIFGTSEQPFMRSWKESDQGQCNDIRDDCVTVSGAAMFIRRQLWNDLTNCPTFREIAPDALGPLLPTQHYYEETWCCYHARHHDYRCVFLGTVGIVHRWHTSHPQGSDVDRMVMPSSRAYFRAACEKHGMGHD